jgi:hypothetical protein
LRCPDRHIDGTGTPAGEAILTLTKEGASFDMSGDKDIVARNVASGTLLVDGKYKTAAETTVTLENAFGDVVYDLGKDAIDSTDLIDVDVRATYLETLAASSGEPIEVDEEEIPEALVAAADEAVREEIHLETEL